MTVFTIIVTYNGMRWLDRCLKSLRQSTVNSIPIIIDNCSPDNTVAYLRENYPEVVLFPQTKNLGFGQANNVGIRYALEHNADYVLLLNQDASIAPDMLEKLLAVSDGNSLLSPIHMNGDGCLMDLSFKRYSLLKAQNTLIDDLVTGKCGEKYEFGEVCAACWLLPISVIKRIGGFNPLFFHYGEDNNYYCRLRYHHVKTFVVPMARMYHDRIFFGNESVYRHQWLFRQMIYIATDINLNIGQSFVALLRCLKECYTQALLRKQYVPMQFCFNSVKLLGYLKRIVYSRRMEKQQKINWL